MARYKKTSRKTRHENNRASLSQQKKTTKTPSSERKVYIPWKRSGFFFKPFPPNVSKAALDNVFDALAIRVALSTVRARIDALLTGCLMTMNKNPPKSNLMEENQENQAAYYNAVLEDVQLRGIKGGGLTQHTTSIQHQTSELPDSPDLRKLHWTTIAILIHVYVMGRRAFVDKANDEKERMVYKKQQPQPQPDKSAHTTAKEMMADDSDDEDESDKGGMVVETDTDEDNLFVTQRPSYEPRCQTQQENRFVALVDEWIQHLDAAKGLAVSNEAIKALQMM